MLVIAATGLMLASGQLQYISTQPARLAVVVDRSASVRGAAWLDADWLAATVRRLGGNASVDWYTLGDGVQAVRFANVLTGPEPAITRWAAPPAADAILLFTDARFTSPVLATPTYVYRDHGLDHPPDARVVDLTLQGEDVLATVQSNNPPSQITFVETHAPTDTELPPGRLNMRRSLVAGESSASARIAAHDRWPENDGLTIVRPPPSTAERWWVGADAPTGWLVKTPDALPTQPADYLRPSIVCLNDVTPTALTSVQQLRVEQYVRDLGGSLFIMAGAQSFDTGTFEDSLYGRLSPLSPRPPGPSVQWILLTDASGSMASPLGEATRFDEAARTMLNVLSFLPADDPVILGSFARDVRWWNDPMTVGKAREASVVPRGLRPGGPTNLSQALASLARAFNPTLPNEVIVLTDGDAALDHSDTLLQSLLTARCRIHVIGIGNDVDAGMPLFQLARRTGGHVANDVSPDRWLASIRQAVSRASSNGIQTSSIEVDFIDRLSALSSQRVDRWMRAWPLRETTPLAHAQDDDKPLAASGLAGLGEVVTFAFQPDTRTLDEVIKTIRRLPVDPRLAITTTTSSTLSVSVEAAEADRPLNDLPLGVRFIPSDDAGQSRSTYPLQQIAPGRYFWSSEPPASGGILQITLSGQVVAVTAIAARYPAEFVELGNDVRTMESLASSTGGQVVDVQAQSPLEIRGVTNNIDLTTLVMVIAALSLAGALIFWRSGL